MKNCGPHSTQLARLSLSVAASAHNTQQQKQHQKYRNTFAIVSTFESANFAQFELEFFSSPPQGHR